jgi:hypothetical protein
MVSPNLTQFCDVAQVVIMPKGDLARFGDNKIWK